MRKEFLPFLRPSITEADIAAVDEVLRSEWITTGSKNAQFEEKLCMYTGCARAVALSSAPGSKAKLMLVGCAPLLELFGSNFTMPDLLLEHKTPGAFLLKNAHKIRTDTVRVADEDSMGAVRCFYKRDDVYLLEGGGEVSYGLNYEDAKYRSLNLKQFKDLVLQNAEKGRVVLIAKSGKYRRWKQNLPEPLYEDINGKGGYVFVQY